MSRMVIDINNLLAFVIAEHNMQIELLSIDNLTTFTSLLDHVSRNFKNTRKFIYKHNAQIRQEARKTTYANKLHKIEAFRFSDAELIELQNLINEMRNILSSAVDISVDQRYRLQVKLDAVRREMKKK